METSMKIEEEFLFLLTLLFMLYAKARKDFALV